MDPKTQNQNEQDQKKQTGEKLGQAASIATSLKRGAVARVVASKLAGFFFSPAGWVTLGIGIVVIFTIIIISSAGAPPADGGIPPAETDNQTANPAPTETVAPTTEETQAPTPTPTEETTPTPPVEP